jgi:hypothetical protein
MKPELRIEDQPGQLDRALLDEDPLLPSSGFAASVMEAIQQESLVPSPIPFPWKIALPGILAAVAVLIALGRYTVLAMRNLDVTPTSVNWLAWLQSSAPTAVLLRTAAAPALLALAASFLCLILCRRLIFGSRNSSAC